MVLTGHADCAGNGNDQTGRSIVSKVRVRPGKASSALAVLMGIAFVVLGLLFLIPGTWADGGMVRWFSVLWVVVAAWIAGYYAYNLFSTHGVTASEYEITDDLQPAGPPSSVDDLDSQLRKLARLRDDGLIDSDDFEHQRERVLSGRGRRWPPVVG